jgi:hypothetical protein
MDKEQKRASVMTTLAVLRTFTNETSLRKRFTYRLPVVGSICREVFATAYEISTRSIMRALKSIDEGMFFRTGHGLEKNTNAKKFNKEHIVHWFKDFASVLGEVIPLRVRKQRNIESVVVQYVSHKEVMMLPAYLTWKQIFDEYQKYSKENKSSDPLPSLRSFQLILHQSCPDIMIRSPISNVCDDCTAYVNQYKKKPCVEASEDIGIHTLHARKMREEYKKDLLNMGDDHLILTMDYSQNYSIPSSARTPSSWYFLSLISVNLFGVFCANTGKQYNFLYSELKGGKGSNEVISMLHHVIKDQKEKNPAYKNLTVYADNCVGQNKNNFVVKFLVLLAHLGEFDEVNIKFFIKGHTKNACDRGFCHIRRHVLKNEIWTFKHLKEAVEDAAHSNECVSLEEANYPFMDYKVPLDEIYNNIKGITCYQIFRSKKDNRGVVDCFVTPEEKRQSLKLTRSYDGIEVSLDAIRVIMKGMTPVPQPPSKVEKLRDMYKKVRPYVPYEFQNEVYYQKPSTEDEIRVSKIKRTRKENRKTLAMIQENEDERGGYVSEDFAC